MRYVVLTLALAACGGAPFVAGSENPYVDGGHIDVADADIVPPPFAWPGTVPDAGGYPLQDSGVAVDDASPKFQDLSVACTSSFGTDVCGVATDAGNGIWVCFNDAGNDERVCGEKKCPVGWACFSAYNANGWGVVTATGK